jgi:hypothetical protein
MEQPSPEAIQLSDENWSRQRSVEADPGPPLEDTRAWKTLEASIRDHLGGHGNVEPVIAPDTALALFAATVLVGHSRDPVFARGYIGACRPGSVRGEPGATRAFENELRAPIRVDFR